MSKLNRIIATASAVIFMWPLAEFVWWLWGPKWCRMRERPSLAMSVTEMRKAGLL